jgi:redox-sensitive bicupin YhaK (pirin superfamily)
MKHRLKPKSELHRVPASDMHPADTYFHFSFAHYFNPEQMNYGVLRVVNDDDIEAHGGFDVHGHRDVEIVTYMVDGELTHWDNATRQEEKLTRGHVQAITAGTGVMHSELNKADARCHLLQIWIMPPARNLPVRYSQHDFEPADRQNRLAHLISPLGKEGGAPLHLNQDVNFYACEFTGPQKSASFKLAEGRQAYIANIEGDLAIEGLPALQAKDSLEIEGPASLEFSAKEGAGTSGKAHFLVIEMPKA